VISKRVPIFSLVCALLISFSFAIPSNASVTTNPTFELDPSNVNSFNPASTSTVYDLVSNRSISGTNYGTVSYSNINGGIFDTFTATGKTGFYFDPAAVGQATNPSGSMTLETWVKFTSWNVTWNIFATRWFTNISGSGVPSDFHFAVKSANNDYLNQKLNLWTTNTSDVYGTKVINLNTWYLLGFTINNSTQELKFYINGQQDGSTITGVTRTANTSNYLFVGDPRTNCTACSFNGQMARFRMCNSVLTSAQMLSNFRSEGAALGYSTTTSLTAAVSPNPSYRTTNLITATVSKPGNVTFYQQGVVIPGCKNRTAASTTATCNWRPSQRGKVSVTASLTPTDLGFVPSTGALNFQVLNRSGARN
jgi:hypothetical protein